MSDDVQEDLACWTPITAIPDGGFLWGHVGTDPVFVWRAGASLHAYGSICPHLGAPLNEGIIVGSTLRCPWHHACFDLLAGAATAAPAFDSLTAYAIDRQDERFALRRVTPTSAPQPMTRQGGSDNVMAIVGGGAAGFAAADMLRRKGYRGEITIYSSEADEPYDRTLLTKDYLDGNFGDDRLRIAQHSLESIGVDFHGEAQVESIDVENKRLRLADGRTPPYSKLLLATGAEPRKLAAPGSELPHVVPLRSLADCRRILGAIKEARRVAIIGGSFIALEAAASLRSRGLSVDVIASQPHPMEKIFGRELSDLILHAHRQNGVRLRLNSKVARIKERHVEIDGGEEVPADLVIFGVGVEPRVELAKRAGLALHQGVTVDSRLRTSADSIFAAGDIARWPDPYTGRHIRAEHWVVAERQGQVAACNMLGADQPFEMIPFFWTKHFDLSILYVGHAEKWDELVIEGNPSRRNATVQFYENERELAIATVGRDGDSLRAELAMERRPQGFEADT